MNLIITHRGLRQHDETISDGREWEVTEDVVQAVKVSTIIVGLKIARVIGSIFQLRDALSGWEDIRRNGSDLLHKSSVATCTMRLGNLKRGMRKCRG
jgi:hypothetical protein